MEQNQTQSKISNAIVFLYPLWIPWFHVNTCKQLNIYKECYGKSKVNIGQASFHPFQRLKIKYLLYSAFASLEIYSFHQKLHEI